MSIEVVDEETAIEALKTGVKVEDIHFNTHKISSNRSVSKYNPVQEYIKEMEGFNGNHKVSILFLNGGFLVIIPIRLSILRKYAHLQPTLSSNSATG